MENPKILEKIRQCNSFPIYSVWDPEFQGYGRIIHLDLETEEKINVLVDKMEKNTQIPETKNIYIAGDQQLESTDSYEWFKQEIYGGLDIQIGYCNGNNSFLGALEYHMGSEVNIAITDMVLFLAHPQNIENQHINSGKVKAFYVPKNTLLELYQGILHFAPCKTEATGFKCVVILLKGTNQDILKSTQITSLPNQTLFKKNKWIYVHSERQDLIEKGAWAGITGLNLELKY